MAPTDVTIEILKGIRDEVKQTNTRIDSLHAEVKETNSRIDSMRDELSHRIVASEVRTATAITDLAYATREMTDVLRSQHDLRPRLDRCERDITELKQQIGMR